MKKKWFKISISFLFLLATVVGITHKAYAWRGNPLIAILKSEWRAPNNRLSFFLALYTFYQTDAENVKSLKAWNANSSIDPNEYTNWSRYKEIRNTYTMYYFLMDVPYNGQYGSYNIEVTYDNNTTETLTTPYLNEWLIPYSSPSNLDVYLNGSNNPVFSFMPVEDSGVENHILKLRDSTSSNGARMVYATIPITQWTFGSPIELDFLEQSDTYDTEDDFEFDRVYLLRVEANNTSAASTPRDGRAFFRSQNQIKFQIQSDGRIQLDQDNDGIENSIDTEPDSFSNRFNNGTTWGEITDRGNQSLFITDEPPFGVRIKTTPDSGPLPAKVTLCGGIAELDFKEYGAGANDVVSTCGSVRLEVLKGEILVRFVADDGSTATTNLNEGNNLVFEPTTFNFTAPSTNPEPVVIVVQDKEYSITPGESVAVVRIDIKPGSYPNCFNLNQKGVIPVAILGSSIFNTQDVDVSSLSLQGVQVKLVGKKSPQYLAHYEDVDGDGYLDLVVQFEDSDGWVNPGQASATLTGSLKDGRKINGQDSICIVQ